MGSFVELRSRARCGTIENARHDGGTYAFGPNELGRRPQVEYGACIHHIPRCVRVLEKCGFSVCAEDKGFADGRGAEVEEYVLRLD